MKKKLLLLIGTIVLVMAMLLAGCATEQSSSNDTKVESKTTTIDSASNVVMVKFNANGGVGTMDDLTADKDTGATLPANTFTKTGYAFSHWTDAVSGQEYADGAAITDMSDDIALTAQWTVKHYKYTVRPVKKF